MEWDKWRVEKGLDSLQLPPTGKALIALRRYETVPDQNPQPTLDDHKRVREVVIVPPIVVEEFRSSMSGSAGDAITVLRAMDHLFTLNEWVCTMRRN